MEHEKPPLDKGDWYVSGCSLADARSLVERFHYAKGASKTAVYTHGLYRKSDDQLLGVAWWLPPTRVACESVNRDDWKRVLGLSRLVVHPDCPKNSATFLLGASVRLIRKEGRFSSLVTYADESQNHTGAIYRAANWEYVGRTKPYLRWLDSNGRQVSAKANTNRTTSQMEANGFVRAGRHSKHKFVLHLEKCA